MLNEANKTLHRKALVTGGANGIGWETCRLLAERGYRIALADIDGEAAAARVAGLGTEHVALQADLADRDTASALPARAAEALGGLDVIVNNAGVTDSSGRSLVTLPEQSFQRLVDLNLSAVDAICAAAAGLLGAGSAIVNLASGASFRPLALRGPYSATKAGIVALTKAYAQQLAPQGISVVAVAPGYTRTPLVEELYRAGRVDLEKVAASIPMRRLAMPGDIAAAIAFCASPDGCVLSGETVLIDGGGSIGPAPEGAAPEVGTAGQGRIAVIGGSEAFSAQMGGDIAHVSHPSQLDAAGPLRAVIDPGPLERSSDATETLRLIRETALACAACKARTGDFALLYVFGEGHSPNSSAAVAAGQMLARTIALEWAPSGLRVNALGWHAASQAGLASLCRFLVGRGASIMTGQAVHAARLEVGVNG